MLRSNANKVEKDLNYVFDNPAELHGELSDPMRRQREIPTVAVGGVISEHTCYVPGLLQVRLTA